jgi:hypothetical protein
MDKKTHDKGLEIRKAVLGEAYVSNALKNADDFNKPFQELVTEYCWARYGAGRNCRARPAACSIWR